MDDGECGDRKSGNGIVTYTENESEKEFSSKRGQLHAVFTDARDRKGYKISGSFLDDDGDAIIKEGFVRYDGTDAYWCEFNENPSSPLRCCLDHLEVLNEGTFDFRNNSFKRNMAIQHWLPRKDTISRTP